MAEIYVAETLQSRRYLASQLLFSSRVSQGLLVLLTLVLTAWLLRRVLRPPAFVTDGAARAGPARTAAGAAARSETRLLIVAFNRYIDRLRGVLSRQERFNADASHQLKTPLAVLKTVSVALARQDPALWQESLRAMNATGRHYRAHRAAAAAFSGEGKRAGDRHFTPVDLVQVVQNCCFPGWRRRGARRLI